MTDASTMANVVNLVRQAYVDGDFPPLWVGLMQVNTTSEPTGTVGLSNPDSNTSFVIPNYLAGDLLPLLIFQNIIAALFCYIVNDGNLTLLQTK